MKISYVLPLVFLLAGLFQACEDEDELPLDLGFDYFPVESGRYVDYQVDSIYHDVPVGVQDTFRFYVRELIDSTYLDAEDRPTNRIQRYYKQDVDDDWQLRDVWVSNRTGTTAEKVEENIRYVKMVFPVDEGVTWDGNAQNTNEEWVYSYRDLFVEKTIGDIVYSNTLTVQQRDLENLIEKQFAREVYALGIGMVYKRLDSLEFTLQNGTSELETGVEFSMRAIGHGVED
jgi:hypothetical protein